MMVSLFSSRIILNELGANDYGILNVVGGLIILFTFLNQSFSATTQRYLSVELVKRENKSIGKIFSVSFLIYLCVVVLVVLLAETVGLWFLNSKMNFPSNRINAVNWVYQFTILTTASNILRAPYNANIIANEKMSFYAYTSLIEAVLKLAILAIFLLQPLDKLVVYAMLLCFSTTAVTFWYARYNSKKFKYTQFQIKLINKESIIEMASFSGWGLFGSIANMGFRQGVNIIINIFLGVAVNAAFGIATQVGSVLMQVTTGFQAALNPQITKTVASEGIEEQNKLIQRSSKFSYYLLFLIALPVVLNTEYLLSIWLKEVPAYTIIFCQLMIVAMMVDVISSPFWVVVFATGKIRNYQIAISSVLLSNILLSYVFLKSAFSPEWVLYARIALFFVALMVRVYFVRQLTQLSIKKFLKNVLKPILLVTVISLPLPFFIGCQLTDGMALLSTGALSIAITCLSIYFFGIDKEERFFVNKYLTNKFKKITGKYAHEKYC